MSNLNHEIHIGQAPEAEARVQEGKVIIAKISALKSGMGKNAIMEYVEFLYICLSRKDAVTDSQTNSG